MENSLSVIIPCFNAQNFIKDALESVISQRIADIEIIVVDDGSTDASAEIVRTNFPTVRLIKTINQGPSKARNLGTKQSNGRLIQYLDADDLLGPRKLNVQIQALNESKADVAYGPWQRLSLMQNGEYSKGSLNDRNLINPEIDLFTDFWSPTCSYLFRRSIVERIGGWNEGLPFIQDARFVLDCALKGAEFIYCNGGVSYYREPSENSVSRKDPVGFNRDIFRNALEIQDYWIRHNGINANRRAALLEVFGYVARSTFAKDTPIFEATLKELKKLSPRYIPKKPKHLRLASQIIGYRAAEKLAFFYRRVRSIFR